MKLSQIPDAVTLILSDARGIYIPRDFLIDNDGDIAWSHCAAWGLTKDNMQHWSAALLPDSEIYWDAWTWILDNAEWRDAHDMVYRLHQDGDLWALCYDKMSDEEKENFGFDC
jgi:hypothetical protein